MFEKSTRRVVKRTGSRTTYILNLRGRFPQPAEAESSLEVQFVMRAALNPHIVDLRHQPYRVPVGEGYYTPDFLIRWADGHTDVVEVKPESEVERFRERFDEVARKVGERGGRFLVVTETVIKACGAHAHAAEVIRYLKDGPFTQDLSDQVIAHLAETPAGLPIGELVQATGASKPHLLHLVACGRLVIETDKEPKDRARIFHPDSEYANDHLFLANGRDNTSVWNANAGDREATQ